MKKMIWFVLGAALAAVIVVAYSRLSESQKRKLIYLAKQAPYLPARYFV